MHVTRWWIGLAAGVWLAACKSSGLPTWEEPSDPGEAVGGDEAAPVADLEAGLGDDSELAEDSLADAGQVESPSDAGEPAAVATRESAVEEPAAPEPAPKPLPKPLFTKVDNTCGTDPGVGQKLKRFKLKTTEGKSISNRSYGSRLLLVNFWGTWCKPCLEELPEFDRLYRRYRNHGLTVVAIATDDDAEPVKEFASRRKLATKTLIGGEAYAGEYASSIFPFTFLVDKKGVIVGSYRGFRPECLGKVEADIRSQLEPST